MQRIARHGTSEKTHGPWYSILTVATYVAVAVALWCVFVYVPTEAQQGIVQRIFYFHVSSAFTMFIAFFLVCVASIAYLWKQSPWWDDVALSAAELGVMFCTIVLITGPIWGRPIWNVWWKWDPTLTLTLVLWLIYVAYLMLRADVSDAKRSRFAAILGIVGFVDVPLIRWSVEKWSWLHPEPVVAREGSLPASMQGTFVIALIACVLVLFFLLRERMAVAQSRQRLEALRDDIDRYLRE